MARKVRGVPYLQLQDEHGNPIRQEARGNALDEFLRKMDDPTYWITIPSGEELQSDLVLSPEELDIINRIEQNQYGDSDYNPYEPLVEFFSSKVMQTPITTTNEPKRRFVPSKWEYLRVMKLVVAIRKGIIKVDDEQETSKQKRPKIYDIWEGTGQEIEDSQSLRISAPKLALPDSRESYNPPSNLLPSQKEIDEWGKANEQERPFLPHRYSCLRHVPGYTNLLLERFSRCLDLFLCPRALRRRTVIDPDELVPTLPDIDELRPFPTQLALQFNGHTAPVKSLSTLHNGNWLLSASVDCSVRVWEVDTGRSHLKFSFQQAVQMVQWNPNPAHCIMAVAVGTKLIITSLNLLGTETMNRGNEFLFSNDAWQESCGCQWTKENESGTSLVIEHPHPIANICWHPKGDYLSVVCSIPSQSWLFIHQISKHRTQSPFKRSSSNDLIKQAQFHPTRPWLYVASEHNLRLFDLVNQENPLLKRVHIKTINCMDIHATQTCNHVLLGTVEARAVWYDLDMSCLEPYRVMRYHRKTMRATKYHPKFPFFATASDDGTVQLFHYRIEESLLKGPLVVPLHVVRVCKPLEGLGVLALDFHPIQPWMFTASSDNSIRLYTS